MQTRHLLWLAVSVSAACGSPSARAWDYVGHRIVNQAALASLPPDFPAFVRGAAATERIAFLAGEPDRWRNVPDLPMKQSGGSWCDHFLDVEQLPEAGLDPGTVSSFRYDFIEAFAAGRAAHAEHFPVIDPAKDADHTREWPGFAPWAITEYYERLKSGFSYLKAFEEVGGTRDEIANAQANIIYVMGVMGHYVGDCAQPLHTTIHHNGWVGENPHGYTTATTFHAWIDGGFIAKVGITSAEVLAKISPAHLLATAPRTDKRDPVFVETMDYLLAQNARVEPLYQLEKAGAFRADGTVDPAAGRAFIDTQLRAGGEMLGSLWVTAWRTAAPDLYLRAQLLKRQAAAVPANK